MSSLRDATVGFVNDVESFCVQTLQNESLSKCTLDARDVLLEKLILLRKTLIHLTPKNDSPTPEPVSPPPYLDMKGNSNKNNPDYVFSDLTESSYEEFDISNQDVVDNEESSYDTFENNIVSSSVAMKDSVMKGYLEKKSRGLFNQYQKRWCVVNNGILYYFTHINDSRQCGNLALNGYEVRAMSSQSRDSKKEVGFELVCPGRRTYQFLAPTKQEMCNWVTAIESQVSIHKSINYCSDETESCQQPSTGREQEIYETLADEKETKNLDSIDTTHEVNLKPKEWYLGKWDCLADEPNELSFRTGQLIHITSKEYDNFSWWVGEIGAKSGLVPKNFLMEAYDLI